MDQAFEKRIKRQVIGKKHCFMALVPLGFENTLVQELKYIGIETPSTEGFKVASDGKVEFSAKITEAWKAVANTRIANRILMKIASFKAKNFGLLEKKAAEVPWELFLRREILQNATLPTPKTTGHVVIHVSCKHSRLYHSDAIAERLQKILEKAGVSNDTEHTDANNFEQHLYVNLQDDRCTIWIDLAGEELYKRGFDRFVNEAPLKETIAAAMLFEAVQIIHEPLHTTPESVPQKQIQTTEKSNHITLMDPMAGSGTFSLEAAYAASGLIPGKCRNFALMHQPAFKESTWNYIIKKSKATANNKGTTITKIITSDISERALEIIKHNIESSPLAPKTSEIFFLQHKDFFSYNSKDFKQLTNNVIILFNPPYGKRLNFDAPKLYTMIGIKLREISISIKEIGKNLTVAIMAPKGPCTENLLSEFSSLSSKKNKTAKKIETSHGGISLNVFIANIKRNVS